MAENITKVQDYTVSGKFDIDSSIKPHGESNEKKQLTLRFVLDKVALVDIITPALSTKRINWANGPGRAKFDTWKDRSVLEIDFVAPGKRVKTRDEHVAEVKGLLGVDQKTAEWIVDNPGKFAEMQAAAAAK